MHVKGRLQNDDNAQPHLHMRLATIAPADSRRKTTHEVSGLVPSVKHIAAAFPGRNSRHLHAGGGLRAMSRDLSLRCHKGGHAMAGILDAFNSLTASSGLADKAGQVFGIDPSLVSRGLGALGPVALGALAKSTATPGGASALFNALPQDSDSGLLSNLSGLFSGDVARRQASGLESLFGAGTGAIGATLSDKLGFNVRPLISMAVPMILGVVSKTVKTQKLNPQGLADTVRAENDAFMKDPANKETAGLVFSALAASDKANALREMFDEAEWLKVRNGPLTALYHVATSSPSGPVGLAKEFTAAADAVAQATRTAPPVSLIGTAFGTGLAQDQLMQLAKEHPEGKTLLDGLHESIGIVARKSPADAEAYRDIVLTAATRAAEASKEGGFLGIGGTKVSEAEQRALDDIRTALT